VPQVALNLGAPSAGFLVNQDSLDRSPGSPGADTYHFSSPIVLARPTSDSVKKAIDFSATVTQTEAKIQPVLFSENLPPKPIVVAPAPFSSNLVDKSEENFVN